MTMQLRGIRIALLVACALLLSVGKADAQSLEKARSLYLDADFQESLREFEGVLSRPGLTKDEATEAHRYLASLRAVLGQKDEAEVHARAALALDPAATPAQGAPKSLKKLFERLRTELGGVAAELTITTDGPVQSDATVHVTAALHPAPEGIANLLSLRCVSGTDAPVENTGPLPDVSLDVKATGNELNCRASALTIAKAPLFEASQRFPLGGGDDGGSVISLGEGSPREDDDEGGSAWPWVIGGGVVAAAAVVAVVLLTSGGGDGVKINTSVEGW